MKMTLTCSPLTEHLLDTIIVHQPIKSGSIDPLKDKCWRLPENVRITGKLYELPENEKKKNTKTLVKYEPDTERQLQSCLIFFLLFFHRKVRLNI